LSALIDRTDHSRVDMNDATALSKIPGVRLKKTREMHAPLYRRRDLYTDRLRLIEKWGWRDTSEPGVLERGVMNADSRTATDAACV
jgi:hypothetical protein